MVFPIYRKYANQHAYFIITSPTTWIEYKRLGTKYVKYDFTAVQFPEKLFVQDLINLMAGIEPSSSNEIAQLLLV